MMPIRPPTYLGLAASFISALAAEVIRTPYSVFWLPRTICRKGSGRVKTRWKYSTASRSSRREASQASVAAP